MNPRVGEPSRAALAFFGGLLTFIATVGGLFIILPWAQSAVLAGVTTGLLARNLKTGTAAGAAAALAGWLIRPPYYWDFLYNYFDGGRQQQLVMGAMVVAVCAVVAGAVGWLVDRAPRYGSLLFAATILWIIISMWFLPITLNAVRSSYSSGVLLPTFNSQLAGHLPNVKSVDMSDNTLFYRAYRAVKRGEDFYPAYNGLLVKYRGAPAESVGDFRVPLLFWLWAALPDAQSLVPLYLMLVTLAVLAVIPLSAANVELPLAIPACAFVASYLVTFGMHLGLFSQEQWAVVFGLMALAAYAISLRSDRWRGWTIAAVVLSVIAVLCREIMAFLPLAGLVSVFFGDSEQRRGRLLIWGAGLGVFAALYGAHLVAVAPHLEGGQGIPRAGRGSIDFVLAALQYSAKFVGQGGWMPYALGAVGMLGMLAARDRRMTIVALGSTLALLVACLFLGNGAHIYGADGRLIWINYWGLGVIPILYAFVPSALAYFAGAQEETQAVAAGDDSAGSE